MDILTAVVVMLAVTVAAGAVAAVIGARAMFRQKDAMGGWVLSTGAAICIVMLMCMGAVYRYETGPSFELLKAEWRCSRSHVVTDDDGDTTVCDQYSRR